MRDWMERTLAAARPLGDRSLVVSALGTARARRGFAGGIDAALAARAEGAALIDALSDEELVRNVDAICVLAGAEVMLDLPHEATAHSERGFAVAEATGQGAALQVLYWTATIRTMRGQLRGGASCSTPRSRSRASAGNAAGARMEPRRPLVRRGAGGRQRARAEHRAREPRHAARRPSARFEGIGAGQALAGALLADGDAAGAHESLLDTGGGETLERDPRPPGGRARSSCSPASGSRSAIAPGPQRTAAHAQDWAATLRSAGRARHGRPRATRSSTGDAALALRSAAAFETRARRSRPRCRARPPGSAFAAAGETERAAAELNAPRPRSRTAARSASATPSERELRRIGRRSTLPPHAPDGPRRRPLTERELQVARLVVDRRTNAEIAAELYLSHQDGRVAPAQPLPQARRELARRGRARRRARR